MAAAPNNGEAGKTGETIHVSEGRYDSSPSIFSAVRINPKRDEALEWLVAFQVEGQPVFWRSKTKGMPVVDQRVSGDLKQVHLAQLRPGESKEIGRLKQRVEPAAVAVALIKAEVVMTYVHVEATMTLDRLASDDKGVDVFFSGEHVYFTNEENRDPLSFVIRVENEGTIRVRNGK